MSKCAAAGLRRRRGCRRIGLRACLTPYCCVRALGMQAVVIATARALPHRPATAGRLTTSAAAAATAQRLRHGCGGCSIAHAVCRAVTAVGSSTCAINVTLLGLSLLISNSPALETIQDAVLVSLNWTGGITSADVKPSLARFMHIHTRMVHTGQIPFFLNSCKCAHSVRYRHCIRE